MRDDRDGFLFGIIEDVFPFANDSGEKLGQAWFL
jgi:hypothetical protein